jgi:hypothetical protein
MTTEAPFQTLAEANEWFAAGKAEHGARGFTATAEYHAHYAAFRALFDADKPARVARKAARQQSREGQSASLLGHCIRRA